MTDTTFGPAYDEKIDGKRVRRQMDVIREFMLRYCATRVAALSLAEIEKYLHYPQASISAQLRHLRKQRFGGYQVEKQRRTDGTWEYRVLPPKPVGQGELF